MIPSKTIDNAEQFAKETVIAFSLLYHYQFDNYVFNTDVTIRNSETIEFRNCIFNGKVAMLDTYNSPVNFQACTFNNDVTFVNATFEGKVRIQSVTFNKKALFNNTKFKELCDFWNTTFGTSTVFYKVDFYKIVVFSRCIFLDNVLFTYSLIEKVIIFRGATFNKGLDLSTAILNGTINLFDFILSDYPSVVRYKNENYEALISEMCEIPEKNKRETFRLIKKQFENQNNHILALNYKALELKSYKSELKKKWLTNENENQNLFILYLNSLSSKDGKSWLRGVVFTFIVGTFFFYLAIVSTDHYEFGVDTTESHIKKMGKLFFEFLTPTHKVDFLDSEQPSTWTYFFDFWGRVFIAYGIYQTIQAFRKYRT